MNSTVLWKHIKKLSGNVTEGTFYEQELENLIKFIQSLETCQRNVEKLLKKVYDSTLNSLILKNNINLKQHSEYV